jgi:hypothetical protein
MSEHAVPRRRKDYECSKFVIIFGARGDIVLDSWTGWLPSPHGSNYTSCTLSSYGDCRRGETYPHDIKDFKVLVAHKQPRSSRNSLRSVTICETLESSSVCETFKKLRAPVPDMATSRLKWMLAALIMTFLFSSRAWADLSTNLR